MSPPPQDHYMGLLPHFVFNIVVIFDVDSTYNHPRPPQGLYLWYRSLCCTIHEKTRPLLATVDPPMTDWDVRR